MTISELYELFIHHPVVTTDSRNCPNDSIFFALKGEKFDGNRFAKQALEAGCSYAIIDNADYYTDERTVVVNNVLETLQQLAHRHRKALGTPLIAVTGTNGKTTTVTMIDDILRAQGKNSVLCGNVGNPLVNEAEKGHLLDTFNQLLDYDALPIVNENDSVYVEELLNGDNDCLSANVAQLINADLLILLTDTDGLYDDNPRKNKDAKLIPYVGEINDDIFKIAGDAGKSGTGGFTTKIKAAKIATDAGIPVVIMNGEKPTSIYKVLESKEIGTYFSAKGE